MNSVKISNMKQKVEESLSEYVARIMKEKDLSAYRISDIAKQGGHQINQSYVNKIKNGFVQNPSAPKIKALAYGLGESEEVVSAIARGVSLEPTEFDDKVRLALLDAEDFDPAQQEELLSAVRRFVAGIRAENRRK